MQECKCRSYDPFGNRLAQDYTTTPCPTQESSLARQFTYTSSNQIATAPTGTILGAPYQYDQAGNVLKDANNQYVYDPEGRLCAVVNSNKAVQYIYDASGTRVAKRTLSA
jgi:YD repeat-containing protein